ncbi:beta-lactamase superfamily domain-containing protein [Sporodiniella umbellata]|nr:beta-lactamase superfamily domain-containing protein [Sporodiniella umbellata]
MTKRPSFVNFPIPFDHPYTIPTLIVSVSASALLYYSLNAAHKQDLKEAIRQQAMYKRRHLLRKQDKLASLKIDDQFVNPFKEWNPSVSIWNTLLFLFGKKSYSTKDLKSLPVVKPDLDTLKEKKASVTWLGLDGLIILTDPVIHHKKRLRPCPFEIDDLRGKVDIVLVSQHRFDHLDEEVVTVLGNSVTWYIPLGLRSWFVKKGVDNVVELDWWQEIHHKVRHDIHIACVPAMHESGSYFNKDKSLCGATGYVSELFQSIHDLYGPFSIATLPIGSYEPHSLFHSLHMNPMEAVYAHRDLGCPSLSIGIHWGTFSQSDENYRSPRQLLTELWTPTADSRFITTSLGETVSL